MNAVLKVETLYYVWDVGGLMAYWFKSFFSLI